MLSWHSLGERSRPEADDWLTAGEAERAAAMRFTKRRDEWLLARWTAKQAVAGELGLADDSASLARIEIRTIIGGEAQGAPEVFVDGVSYDIGISLTDRAGWAVCAVGAVDELGCDLELVEPRSEGFVRDFLTPCEQAAVAAPRSTLPGRRRQPRLVGQGERTEGAAHRPPAGHQIGRGRLPVSLRSRDGSRSSCAPRRVATCPAGGGSTASSCSPSSPAAPSLRPSR